MSTNVMQTLRSQAATWELGVQAPPESISDMLMSVGRELGLFEALVALGNVTAPALARCTGFDEGFLCEWLDAMVVLGQVEFDSATACFASSRQDAGPPDARRTGDPS